MRTHVNEIATQSATLGANRLPTSELWKNCPFFDLKCGTRDGFADFIDFTEGVTHATNVAAAASALPNGMCAFTGATAGSGIATLATIPTGVISLANATDNETTVLSLLGGKNQAGQLIFEAGKKVWFETRVKVSTIADSKFGVFVGMAEEALAVTVGILAAAGTLTDKDLVGFWRVEGDGDKLDLVFNTAGGGGITTLAADAVTLAADTWVKLMIYCDGTTVFFYADGVLLSSVALTATNFPNGEEMALYFAMTMAATEAGTVGIDWVKYAELRG
jgi:hypothetical protein